ncbi:unnamed protein product [Amoebophrya sp. A25]|nr:unnamed protein product [Amoebophrya sp. A25]|eukprot:GSA25T00025207001.1
MLPLLSPAWLFPTAVLFLGTVGPAVTWLASPSLVEAHSSTGRLPEISLAHVVPISDIISYSSSASSTGDTPPSNGGHPPVRDTSPLSSTTTSSATASSSTSTTPSSTTSSTTSTSSASHKNDVQRSYLPDHIRVRTTEDFRKTLVAAMGEDANPFFLHRTIISFSCFQVFANS